MLAQLTNTALVKLLHKVRVNITWNTTDGCIFHLGTQYIQLRESYECTCIYRSVNIDISVPIDYIQGDVYYNTIICTVMLHIYVYSSN